MGGLRDEVGKWAHMPTSSKAGSAYQRDVFVIRGSLSSLQFLYVCPCGKASTHSTSSRTGGDACKGDVCIIRE